MTLLTVWSEDDASVELLRTSDSSLIASTLDSLGVSFSRWDVIPAAVGASSDEILNAYAGPIEQVKAEQGYIMVDAVALRPDPTDPEWQTKAEQARNKFLTEHSHDDDEVRFFAEGAGVFYLRIDGKINAVLCTAGDLIGVPKGTRHWFDMGTTPHFAAVRFFLEDDGWVGNFTGDEIASRFPTFDELYALV